MKSKRSLRMALALVACMLLSMSAVAASRSAAAVLEAEIERIARPARGEVGVAAWRLDGIGPRVLVRGKETFPIASTFKIAVAGAVLAKIDVGESTLGQMVAIDPAKHVLSPVDARSILVAVFTKKSDAPFADRERSIADTARAVHDFYLFGSAQ